MVNSLVLPIASIDSRLRRNINHDPRSRDYLMDVSDIAPQDIEHHFPGQSFILNQGEYGYCTAEAAHYNLWADVHWLTAQGISPWGPQVGPGTEEWGLYFYANETANDPYPGTFTYPPPGGSDTGSDGLTSAQRLKAMGYIDSYQHTFTANDALLGLQKWPLSWGTLWKDGMDAVDRTTGQARYTGTTRGGHQVCGYKVDWTNERLWLKQSWGAWGYQDSGVFWVSFDDFAASLKDQGDVTFFVPKVAPAPPAPSPSNVDPKDVALLAAAKAWEPSIISHLTKAGRLKMAIDQWKINHGYTD